MGSGFTSSQRRILVGIVSAYTLAYLTRLNLSAALASVIRDLNISPSAAGLMPTLFAAVYACGQMVNGFLADRVRPVRLVVTGLAGTALCNILIGAAGSFALMAGLCALNGVFQSMLWTPLVCLVAANYEEGKVQFKAHFYLSLTLALGHFAAWGVSGWACQAVGWRFGFIIPGIVTALLIPAVVILMKGARLPAASQSKKKAGAAIGESLRTLVQTGFVFLALGCVLYGFVKDGLVTWTPEILNAASAGDALSAAAFSMIVPVLNLLGILAGYWLRGRSRGSTRQVIARLVPFMGLACAPLLLSPSLVVIALCLGAGCACAYGVNPLFTSLIPMEYEKYRCVGLAAGLIDCFIYIGASLSGVAGGAVYEAFSQRGLGAAWLIASVLAALLVRLSAGKHSRHPS